MANNKNPKFCSCSSLPFGHLVVVFSESSKEMYQMYSAPLHCSLKPTVLIVEFPLPSPVVAAQGP